jgi:hypothetical protein
MPRTSRFSASVAVACLAAALGAGAAQGCGETIELPVGGNAPKPDPSARRAARPRRSDRRRRCLWCRHPLPRREHRAIPDRVRQWRGGGGIVGGGGMAGPGGLAGGPLAACAASTSVHCFDNGRGARASITPLDCDSVGAGYLGDPARVQVTCEQALDGQSGERCQGFDGCGRGTQDSCCAQVVTCKAGSSLLRRYRRVRTRALPPAPQAMWS